MAEQYFEIGNALADRLAAGNGPLAGVAESDREGVLEAALAALPEVIDFLGPYAMVSGEGQGAVTRVAFCCLTTAATFPAGGTRRIADLATLAVLFFGLDDVLDGHAGPGDNLGTDWLAEFGTLLADPGAAVRQDPATSVGQLLAAWSRWCERLRRYPLADAQIPTLLAQLELAWAAMRAEQEWTTGSRPWPDVEEYLANGLISSLYPTWWAAALAMRDVTEPVRWAVLEQATNLGATCIRLVNDVRTFEREKREGKPNMVALLTATGMAETEAVRRVLARLAETDAVFRTEIAKLPSELADVAQAQLRSVTFNTGWYRERDTHAFTVGDLVEQAGGGRAVQDGR